MKQRQNIIRRGDGKKRTVAPTQRSLNLLRRVANKMTQEAWTTETLTRVVSGQKRHCVLGWLDVESRGGGYNYPSDRPHVSSLQEAVALLVETINGPAYKSNEGQRHLQYDKVFILMTITVMTQFLMR